MSTTIDNKVVSMEFNNKNFEKNVKQSMSTIDKLKKKLKFDKAAQDFDKLDKAAQKVRFDTMGHGIDSVKMKLSALDVFAVTAFHRISDTAITTGKNMVKAFTIDPVKTGLQEYETQINAVQTILANTKNKGSTIDDVNRSLDELNTYADKTIYNFTEMTRNIGTFTAAGVGLKESTQAIKGIANLAAVSGSNAQQASTAMYQLSQALAAGKVSLQDWNSVVNAGMGGEVFQEALKRTSRVLGTGVDEAIKKYGTFRESLTQGAWLTTDVLTETLAQLSGAYTEADLISQGYTKKQAKEITDMAQTATDAATKVKTFTQLIDTLKEAAQSGWTQTWELIIGDFEEAKALFTEASDYIGGIIGKSADDRNNLVKGAMQNVVSSDDWAKLKEAGVATKSFKNAIIETAEANGISIKKMIEDNGSFEKTLKTGWLNKDILTKTLKKNEKQLSASTLKMSKSMMEYFKIADQVMKGSWGKGKQAQEALTKAGYDYAQVQKLVNGMTKYGAKEFEKMCLSQLKSEGVTKKQAKALTELAKEAKKTGTPINELMEKMERKSGRELLIDTIRNSALAIIKPFKAMKKAWQEIFPPKTSEELYNIINSLHEFSVKLLNFDKNGEKLTRTFKGLFSILSIFTGVLKTVASTVFNIVSNSGIIGYILDLTANIGDLCVKIRESILESSKISSIATNAGSIIGTIISKIKELLSFDATKMSKNLTSILDIIISIGKKIGSTVSEIGSRFMDTLSTMFENFDANKLMNLLKVALESGVFLTITKFIKNVIKAIKDVTSSIDSVINNISEIFDGLAKCLSSFQNKINSEALKNIAISLAILTASILLLSTIDPSKTNDILSQLTVMFIELMAAMRILSKASQVSGMYATSLAMINMSISISVLASAMKKLSEINDKSIEKGIVAIGALMLELVAASKLMSINSGKVAKGAFQMIIMSGAVKILASVCEDLGNLPMNQIKKGLIGVGGLLGELAIFMDIAGFGKKAVRSATSMLLISASLKILASVCNDIAKIKESDIKKSIIAISALLAAFAVFENLSGRSKQLLRTSIVLSVATICLSSVANTLTKISKISVNGLEKSVGAISAVLLSIATITRIMPTSGLIDMSITLPSFASAIAIIGEVMKKISGIPFKKLAASLGAVTIVIAEMAVTLRLIKGYAGASRVFVMTAIAMTILASSLKTLGSIGIIGAVTSIGLLASQMTILGIASKLINPVALLKLSGSITTFSLSLLALSAGVFSIGAGLSSMLIGLSAAFLTISQIKFSEIGKGFVVIIGAFTLLGVAAKLMKPLIPSLMSMSLAMASFGLACIALGVSISLVIGSLAALGALGPTTAKDIVSTLETILVGFLEIIPKITTELIEAVVALIGGLCDGIIRCIPKVAETLLYLISEILNQLTTYAPAIIDSILTLVINIIDGLTARVPELLGSIANFIGAIVNCITTSITQVDTSFMLKLIESTTLLIGITVGLAKIKKSIASAMISVLGMAGIMAILGGIIGALSLLPVNNALPISIGLSTLLLAMSASLAIISKVGKVSQKSIVALYAISGAVAVLGVILSAMSALNVEPSIETATALSILLLSMTAVCGALSLIGPISAGAMSGVKALDSVILAIGGLVVGLGALVDKFPCLETFLNKGIGLLNALAKGIGEFVGNIIGGIAEGVTNSLPVIGENLSDFADSISGIDPKVSEIAKSLAEALLVLGGANILDAIAGWITGDSSMEDFAAQLKKFAQGIVDFSNVISNGNVDGALVQQAAEAGKKIVELASLIPNSGGWLGNIVGNNDIEDFAPHLKEFGKGIADFSKSVDKKIKIAGINDANSAGKKIIELAKLIPNSGGWLGNIVGNNDIDKFAPKLKEFGQGIADFSKSVDKKIKTNQIDKVTKAGKKIISFAKILYDSDDELRYLATSSKFGKNLKSFCDSLSSVAKSSLSKVSSKTLDVIHTNIKKLTNITALMKKMNANNIKSLPKEFSTLSKISINSFISNFKGSTSKVVSAINATLNSAISTIKSKHSSFYSSGSYCVEGFVSGIMSKVNSGNIYGAGRKIGDEALRGARESLDIHSPSKKMKEVAKYTVDGFVNYIKGAGANKVSASSIKMANTHTKTFNKTINKGIKKNSSSTNKTIKSQGSKTVKTVSKVADSVLSAWKKKLKSAKKYYNKYIKDVTKHTSKTMTKFVKSGVKPTKVEMYASGAMDVFAREYLKTTKDVMVRSSKAAKAISGFVKALYMESDAYKEDQSNLKNLYKEQKKLYAQRISLYKKLSKTKDKKKSAEYKKKLKELNKEIDKTNKKIKDQQKNIEKNIKKAYQEYIKGLKESIKSFTDITKITKETINLFDTSVLDTLESTSDGFDDLRESVTDSMKSMVSVLDVTLDTGVDILGEFKDSTEEATNAIAEAEQELADANKDVAEAQNEYNEAQKELIKWQNKSNSVFGRSQRYLDKIKDAQDKLTEAQNKLTEATNKQIEANENLNALKTDTSVTDMLSNMKNNVDSVKDFRKDIDELAKRGLDDGLLQYLKDLGVSGAETIKTFTKMTDEQLKEAAGYFKDYNSLSSKSLIDGFEEKSKAMLEWGNNMQKLSNLNLDANVKKALLSEFQEQGVDSSEYLKTIINMTDAELKQFNEDYLKMLKVPEEVANTVTEAQKKVDEANKQNSTATADTYIATMKANIELQKSYDKNLAELKNRVNAGIISEDFYEYIKEQGIESNDMISEFLRSSDDKLKEASELYAESAKITGDKFIESYKESITDSEKWGQAITALSKLDIPNSLREELIKQAEEEGPDSLEWLDTLLGFTPSQWKKYVAAWKKRNKDMSQIPKDIAAAHAKIQYDKDHPYVTAPIEAYKGEFKEAEMLSTIETGTKHIEISLDKAHGEVMEFAISKAREGAKHVAEQAIGTLSNGMSETKTADIGKSSCKGLSKGLKGNINTVKDSAYNVASVIVNTIKNKLSELDDINLISGLSRLSTTSNNMHKAAKSSARLMKKAIVKVASAGNSNTVSTPTIRPVIDMSSAKTSISHMKGMLSSNAINTNAALASDVARSSASRKGLSQNESTTNNYDSSQHTIENHFNITGDNPREIANEVSRIIQNQINRRSATWV